MPCQPTCLRRSATSRANPTTTAIATKSKSCPGRGGLGQSAPAAGGSGGGGAAGRTTFSDFTFTHVFDKALPALMKSCATGQHLREATIAARKAGQGQQDYLIIKMSDVIITSIHPTVTAESPLPVETVSLRFGKVDLETNRNVRTGHSTPAHASPSIWSPIDHSDRAPRPLAPSSGRAVRSSVVPTCASPVRASGPASVPSVVRRGAIQPKPQACSCPSLVFIDQSRRCPRQDGADPHTLRPRFLQPPR